MSRILIVLVAVFNSSLSLAQSDVSAVIGKVAPSVVAISAKSAKGTSDGSGFIVSADGKIATSLHLIERATSVSVNLATGESYKISSVLAFHPRTNLALIKIDGLRLPAVDLGDSDKIVIGEMAVVVGSPEGSAGTATPGKISAIRPNPSDNTHSLLQTDAVVNSRDSGGPLVNSKAQVIGMIVSKSHDSKLVNFAIPINYLRGYLAQPMLPMNLGKFRTELWLSRPSTATDEY